MDQIFYNGTILPMTEETATAEAMLCRDGYIAALGSMEEILALQEGREAESGSGRPCIAAGIYRWAFPFDGCGVSDDAGGCKRASEWQLCLR